MIAAAFILIGLASFVARALLETRPVDIESRNASAPSQRSNASSGAPSGRSSPADAGAARFKAAVIGKARVDW